METFFALLALCEGNQRSPLDSPHKGQWCRAFLDLHLNKQFSKQSRWRWFEMPSHSLWRHCNELSAYFLGCIQRFRNTVLHQIPIKTQKGLVSYLTTCILGRTLIFLMKTIMNDGIHSQCSVAMEIMTCGSWAPIRKYIIFNLCVLYVCITSIEHWGRGYWVSGHLGHMRTQGNFNDKMVEFLENSHLRHSINLGVHCGFNFWSILWYSASVTTVIHVISYHIEWNHNGTWVCDDAWVMNFL